MRVLVTGATGLIGGAVARRLKAGGHEVVALARSDASATKLACEGFAVRHGDLADAESVAAADAEAASRHGRSTRCARRSGPSPTRYCDHVISGEKAERELGWRPSRRSIVDELRSAG